MTVVAYKDGIMAADSGSSSGDLVAAQVNKIHRLRDGSLFGASGWRPVINKAMAWVEAGADGDFPLPAMFERDDLDALVVRPDGAIWRIYQSQFYKTPGAIETAGSHHEFLMGAMLAGATAIQAVEIAIQYGKYAHGPVQWKRLSDGSPSP